MKKVTQIEVGGEIHEVVDSEGRLLLQDEVQRAKMAEDKIKADLQKVEEITEIGTKKLNSLLGDGEDSISGQIEKEISEVLQTSTDVFEKIEQISDWFEEDTTGSAALVDKVTNIENTKADKNGRYPDLSVGFSDNLVGRNETKESDFIFQPTANDWSVEDGAARIERIKGNTLVWNQLIDKDEYGSNHSKITKEGDAIIVTTMTEEDDIVYDDGNYDPYIDYYLNDHWVADHKYYFSIQGSVLDDEKQSSFPVEGQYPEVSIITQIYGAKEGTPYMIWRYANHSNFGGNRSWRRWERIVTGDSSQTFKLFRVKSQAPGVRFKYKEPLCIDLTRMFGAGNEPTTVAEFRAMFPEINPEKVEGRLVDFKGGKLETDGFNQLCLSECVEFNKYNKDYTPQEPHPFKEGTWWNGIAANGYALSTIKYNGVKIGNNSLSGTSNGGHSSGYGIGFPVRVIPGEKYYLNFNSPLGNVQDAVIGFFDAEGKYIHENVQYNHTFTASPGAYWALIVFKPYGTDNTVKLPMEFTDINLNLYHSGYRNGEVELGGEKDDITIDLSSIKDKEGNLVFPDGCLRSAGNIYDEIIGNKVIRRIGVIEDLGALDWKKYSTGNSKYRFIAKATTELSNSVLNLSAQKSNIAVSAGFNITSAEKTYEPWIEYSIFAEAEKHIYLFSPKYQTYTENRLKEEVLSGVKMYYELANPEVYELPESIPLDYRVWDFGTEHFTPELGGSGLKANINYGFNAVDQIRANRDNIENILGVVGENGAAELNAKIDNLRDTLGEQKADKDGFYPTLTSGFSENLIGRGEAVEAQFSFRQSGGEQSIEDGVARIERIKGNTIVWNQLANIKDSITENGLTIESVGDGSYKLYTAKNTPTTADVFYPVTDVLTSGRKVIFYGGTSTCTLKASNGVQDVGSGAIITSVVANEVVGIFIAAGTIINTAVTIFPQVFDLTKMFTVAADIPTTVDEFKLLFSERYYPYNTGELLSLSASGIKSVGFNQFNKATAKKGYAISYGEEVAAYDYFCSDYIKVIPNQTYYISYVSNIAYLSSIAMYDASYRYLKTTYVGTNGANTGTKYALGKLTITDNRVGYIRVNIPQGYLDKCCVNFSHTGYRDGEYEPYEETTRLLPIKEYFPDGMRSARSVYDELTATQAIKRVGVIPDMSTLAWYYSSQVFYAAIPNIKEWSINNFVTPLYLTGGYPNDKGTGIYEKNLLYIKDLAFTNVADFKKHIKNVPLFYEMAREEVIILSEPLNLSYKVWDFGTEEILGNEIPIKADIVYGFNAVDTIRGNKSAIDSLKENLSDLDNKIEAEDTDIVVESIEENLVTNALRKTAQVLTDAEKQQVQKNIGVDGLKSDIEDVNKQLSVVEQLRKSQAIHLTAGTPSTATIPSITNDVLDLGENPVFFVGEKSYNLRELHPDNSNLYRAISLHNSVGSTNSKLLFDTSTATFRSTAYYSELGPNEVIIGTVRLSTDGSRYYSFPFEVRSDKNWVDNAISNVTESVADIRESIIGSTINTCVRNGSQSNAGNLKAITIYGYDTQGIPVTEGEKYIVSTNRPNREGCKYYTNIQTFKRADVPNLYTDVVRSVKSYTNTNVVLPTIDEPITIREGEKGLSIQLLEFQEGGNLNDTPLRVSDFKGYYLKVVKVSDGIISRIDDIDRKVAELASTNIVFERNKGKTIALIQACRLRKSAENSKDYQMLICTDSHNNSVVVDNAVMATNGFETIDAMIHCGDILAGHYIPDEVVAFNKSVEKCEKPLYIVVGNHDVGNTWYVAACATHMQTYDSFIKPMVDSGVLKSGEYQVGKPYWHHDDVTYKIRLIGLYEYDDPMDFDTTYWKPIPYDATLPTITETTYNVGDKVNAQVWGYAYSPPYTEHSFECVQACTISGATFHNSVKYLPKYKIQRGARVIRQEQAQWFLDTLASTPENYTVIVAMHNPFSEAATTIQSKFTQNVGLKGVSYSQNLMQTDFIRNAIVAFIKGSNYTESVVMKKGDAAYLNILGSDGDEYAYTVSKDFSTKNSGVSFGCILGGHVHRDLVWKDASENIYQVTPICATSEVNNSSNNDIARTLNDGIAKDCLTVFSQRANKIALVKLGVDTTIDAKERDFEVINTNE